MNTKKLFQECSITLSSTYTTCEDNLRNWSFSSFVILFFSTLKNFTKQDIFQHRYLSLSFLNLQIVFYTKKEKKSNICRKHKIRRTGFFRKNQSNSPNPKDPSTDILTEGWQQRFHRKAVFQGLKKARY